MRRLSAVYKYLLPSDKTASGLLLFLGFFILYGSTHDHIYAFDSLLSALTIRGPLFREALPMILSWNHFLWLPLIRWFFLALHTLGSAADTYAAIQWWNTCIGALLLMAIYRFLAEQIHRHWALLVSCLAGVSHVVWLRSTSGDPYLTGTLLALTACYLITLLPARPGKPVLLAIAVLGVMAVYLHIANIILLPFSTLLIARRQGPQNRLNALFVLLVSGVLLLPYIFFYDLTTFQGLKEWLVWGSGQVNGQAPGTSASGQFDLHFLKNIQIGLATLFQSAAAAEINGPYRTAAAALASVAVCVPAAINYARQKKDRAVLLPALTFFAATSVFFSIWIPGNLFYWASPLVFFILTLALSFAQRLRKPPGRIAILASAALILSLGAFNFRNVIQPNMEGSNVKPLINFCGALKEITPASGVIIISGKRAGFLKVAIPYFAQRRTLALDLAFIQYYGTGQDPVAAVQNRLNAFMERATPVYMLDDILLAKGEFAPWGVTPERIDELLRPYKLTLVARLSAAEPGVLYKLSR